MTDTPLDTAHAAMMADDCNDAARLRFYERMADAELYLLLEAEPEGDQISPRVLEHDDQSYLLAFDRAQRLASYAGDAAAYVALSGRNVAAMLEDQPLGIALNLDVASSSILLPPEAVTWLRQTLDHRAGEVEAHIESVMPPKGLPENLIEAIDAKLATATGMAANAWLVGIAYKGGGRGHLLAFIDAIPRAQDALVRAASEALTFSGIEAGAMDVGFFNHTDPVVGKLMKVGLRFDLPQMETLQNTPRMPGSDPDAPPILK
ncbi:SseB family protein [Sulfitobacter sp. S190]|uniref:SseB family protein n=1 Tax=Sulfitobacter sp. S190 TaxID=2867022 RepID=UPI0021A89434|nr:SseB family protein [Sulfitobacter sp. S190]UWR21645.1 SseB family protein [Sulfitobacter sp. S190]